MDFKKEISSTSLKGELILPSQKLYNQHRKVWNGAIDVKPTAIVRCLSVDDVVQVVKFCSHMQTEMTIRSGGHQISGLSVAAGAILLDMSCMKAVVVDPGNRIARVQGGALWKDFDTECGKFGLGTSGGLISTTGVAGLTLGGGIGWLTRKYGLACDNLIEAQVVLANGDVVRATDTNEHKDLLFGLRGGGGNFGVVTEFVFHLYPVKEVLKGMFMYPLSDAEVMLRAYRKWAKEAPNNQAIYAFLSPQGVMIISIVHSEEDLEKAEASLFGKFSAEYDPIYSHTESLPYAKLQCWFDEGNRAGKNVFWRSSFLESFSNEFIDSVADLYRKAPHGTTIEIMHLGGAFHSNGESISSAFTHRDAIHEIHSISIWEGEEKQVPLKTREWIAQFSTLLKTSKMGAYLNVSSYVEDETKKTIESNEVRARRAFGPNYEKLVSIKTKYDPQNFFHHNHNIPITTTNPLSIIEKLNM